MTGLEKEKEAEMTVWTPYLLAYLAGLATPILVVRQLLRARGDEGACLMEFALAAIGVVVVAVIAMGMYQ
jgi:hypothetical protein